MGTLYKKCPRSFIVLKDDGTCELMLTLHINNKCLPTMGASTLNIMLVEVGQTGLKNELHLVKHLRALRTGRTETLILVQSIQMNRHI